MGYRILYHSVQKKPGNRGLSIRLPVLTLICFLLFLFLAHALWPEGTAAIQMVISTVREGEAFSVFNDLAEELRFGEPLVTAFSDFCGKLIS